MFSGHSFLVVIVANKVLSLSLSRDWTNLLFVQAELCFVSDLVKQSVNCRQARCSQQAFISMVRYSMRGCQVLFGHVMIPLMADRLGGESEPLASMTGD